MTLTIHHLQLTARARTPVELDDQAGSQIRGAVMGALWQRFCTNQAATSCADCPLLQVCPVAALLAPMRAEGETGGEQRPRPYVIRPPQHRDQQSGWYHPGDSLTFGIGLFGRAAPLFPYLVLAAHELEQHGIGRPLRANRGQRGQLQITQIDSYHPLTGATERLLTAGERQVQQPGLPISAEDVDQAAEQLPSDRLLIDLHTPLRLIEEQRLVRRFSLRPFIQRLLTRLEDIAMAYGSGPYHSDYPTLMAAATATQVIFDQTRWVDVVSRSARQGGRTPIGGLVGRVVIEGPLAPLRPLLVWGSLIHVGKNAVKGDGWYTLHPAERTIDR